MHKLIFEASEWIGEGTISFTSSPMLLPFYTHWVVDAATDGIISCEQRVEKQGIDEILSNSFRFSNFKEGHFDVELTTQEVGTVLGKGSWDEFNIGWSFNNPEKGFIGKEVYHLQKNGEYLLHAEYSPYENFHITIDGRIWSIRP